MKSSSSQDPGRYTDHPIPGYDSLKPIETLKKLGDLFCLLGPDPHENIHIIVRFTNEVLQSACSLYNRLDNKSSFLICWPGHDLPEDFQIDETPDGHICYDATIKGQNQPVVIPDISKTRYQNSDQLVKRYGLKSYLGYPVHCNGIVVGSLAVVDLKTRQFDENEIHYISALANAISLEEDRIHVNNELKNSKMAYKDSQRRYRKLYNNMPVLMCFLDSDARLTSVNDLWLDMMGYERDEVLGRQIFDFFSEQSRQEALDVAFPELHKTGCLKSQTFTVLTQNKESKTIQFSAVAEKSKEDKYIGALAFAVDITESERSNLEKSRLSTRLQQAQKMEAIATLAGGVAHQFNNALAVIMGNLELIQMEDLQNEKIGRYIDPIGQAGQKMVQLTGQLLAYARGGKFQTQTIAAHTFVKETLRLVKHSIAPKVEIRTDLDTDTDHIDVDLTQMQMLLAAILSNASEAMDGQGSINICLKNTKIKGKACEENPGLKPGNYVLLSISDNGRGMNEQTRERIFEPFFTTKFQGRGLGMAAVYGIVKKHGGFVYVDSVAGGGTTVSIYLMGTKSKPSVAEKVEAFEIQRSGTALIVEDEHLVMEVNRAIVEKLGYHVLEARTGKEAIELVKSHEGRIDFVLLDVILPDMDGSHIYPKLVDARPGIKVIVCSGFALDGPARQILESGAESFVQKPFTMAALSAVLKKIFNEDE